MPLLPSSTPLSPPHRLAPDRVRKPQTLLLGLVAALLLGCGGDPLVVVGRVDVTVASDFSLVVDFPVATTLVRSPVAINSNVAGECTVTRDGFETLVAREDAGTGLRRMEVSSDAASVDIGGVVYTALESDAGCLIQTRAIDAAYGNVTFDIDCTLHDETNRSISAVGVLTFEGCH